MEQVLRCRAESLSRGMQRPGNDALDQGGVLFSAVSKCESALIAATYQEGILRGDTRSASYCHADLALLWMGAEAARQPESSIRQSR